MCRRTVVEKNRNGRRWEPAGGWALNVGVWETGRRVTPRRGGFSLIEVLVSVVILGVGLVGLTQGITTALNASKETELQANAALLAAGRIETLRVDGYLEIGEQTGQGGEGFSRYQWRQSIESTGIENLFEVTVTVEGSNTGKRIYQLRTLLFEAPIGTNSFSSQTLSRVRRRPAESGSLAAYDAPGRRSADYR